MILILMSIEFSGLNVYLYDKTIKLIFSMIS